MHYRQKSPGPTPPAASEGKTLEGLSAALGVLGAGGFLTAQPLAGTHTSESLGNPYHHFESHIPVDFRAMPHTANGPTALATSAPSTLFMAAHGGHAEAVTHTLPSGGTIQVIKESTPGQVSGTFHFTTPAIDPNGVTWGPQGVAPDGSNPSAFQAPFHIPAHAPGSAPMNAAGIHMHAPHDAAGAVPGASPLATLLNGLATGDLQVPPQATSHINTSRALHGGNVRIAAHPNGTSAHYITPGVPQQPHGHGQTIQLGAEAAAPASRYAKRTVSRQTSNSQQSGPGHAGSPRIGRAGSGDDPDAATGSAPGKGGKRSRATTSGAAQTGSAEDAAENMVEKRLKQNREAARRSRDRKRRLKEDLLKRMPQLQKQHDNLSNDVGNILKHMWSSKEGLLSSEMQALLLAQSLFHDRCACLTPLLETTDDSALDQALQRVDGAWTALHAAFEATRSGFAMFLLLNSANAPPKHKPWYHLGGVNLSYVVRTFLQLQCDVPLLDSGVHATLSRLVEGWTFQEVVLQHGRKELERGFVEASIMMAQQRRSGSPEMASGVATANLAGFLDNLEGLFTSAFALRKHIMTTLRRLLPMRTMCLFLVVQVLLLDGLDAEYGGYPDAGRMLGDPAHDQG